jgi:hypothetical protein
MLDHRMRRVATELADDAQQDRPRLRAATGKLDLALAGVGFDAVEPFEEVIVPGNAAKLAIGDRFEPDLLLSADDVFDLAILDVLKGLGRNLAARALLARRFQGYRPQQTADMIGPKRRLGARHHLPPDFLGDLDHHTQLRPLLFFGKHVALLGRGKAALRR